MPTQYHRNNERELQRQIKDNEGVFEPLLVEPHARSPDIHYRPLRLMVSSLTREWIISSNLYVRYWRKADIRTDNFRA
jgi:hypothetical protein